MRIFEILEAKSNKKIEKPVTRNYVAKNAPKSGAGAHEPKKYDRKEKHKNKTKDVE